MKLNISIIFSILLFAACVNNDNPSHDTHAEHKTKTPSDPNNIDIPPSVRRSLGITFAKVQHRPVSQTLRLPGEFELRPEGIRECRAMTPGRVTLHVEQFQRVSPGELLFTIDSPLWRDMQHEAVEAHGAMPVAQAALQVSVAIKSETEKAATFLEQRIRSLGEAEMRNVELESQLAALRNKIPRLEAEIAAKRVELDEAGEHYQSRLNTLASLSGLTHEELKREDNHVPRWRTLSALEIRSDISGIVDSLSVTNGGWLETGGLAMVLVDPTMVRFRAQALQSDLSRLQSDLHATIVPPSGGSISQYESINADLSIGYRASSKQRTIPLYAMPHTLTDWARPGAVGFLEVLVGGSTELQLAIPESAIMRDGLMPIFFRRDPHNPDKARRLQADLGESDGRWVAILSGVREGDEVVLDGVHQLMLALSGSEIKGGHVHADGTFHEEH